MTFPRFGRNRQAGVSQPPEFPHGGRFFREIWR
jgi:hypothetical protein